MIRFTEDSLEIKPEGLNDKAIFQFTVIHCGEMFEEDIVKGMRDVIKKLSLPFVLGGNTENSMIKLKAIADDDSGVTKALKTLIEYLKFIKVEFTLSTVIYVDGWEVMLYLEDFQLEDGLFTIKLTNLLAKISTVKGKDKKLEGEDAERSYNQIKVLTEKAKPLNTIAKYDYDISVNYRYNDIRQYINEFVSEAKKPMIISFARQMIINEYTAHFIVNIELRKR